jgi:hypothetical protein
MAQGNRTNHRRGPNGKKVRGGMVSLRADRALEMRKVVWELRVMGYRCGQITDEMNRRGYGVKVASVKRWLMQARKEVQAGIAGSVDEWRAEQVEQYTEIYRRAMGGFERSQRDAEVIRERREAVFSGGGVGEGGERVLVQVWGPDGELQERILERTVEKRAQAGDPAFLGRAIDALDRIRKVLGFEPTAADGPATGGGILQIVINEGGAREARVLEMGSGPVAGMLGGPVDAEDAGGQGDGGVAPARYPGT